MRYNDSTNSGDSRPIDSVDWHKSCILRILSTFEGLNTCYDCSKTADTLNDWSCTESTSYQGAIFWL